MEKFRRLYETVYQDLYRLAYYYLGDAADAEDAVQETALAAWRHFDALRRKESFRAWIFQILVNVCRKMQRERAQRREFSADTMQAAEPGTGMEMNPNLAERLELLDLLSGLDEEECMIILLTVFGGYKGEEIAQILGRRHSTVRSRYRRALKKLEKDILEKKECRKEKSL